MNIFNHRFSSFAVILLLAGNSSFAQVNNAPANGVPVQDSYGEQMMAKDVAYYVPDNTYKLPWEPIRVRDIAWKKRVWRNIDASDAQNGMFASDPANPNKNSLVSVFLEDALSGKIKAYSGGDDRFTKELSREEIIALITPGNGGANPEQVSRYQIKEDWLFVQDKNKLVVRIVGIAPVVQVTGADGSVTDKPLFWIYYPNSRNYLAQHKVMLNGKNYEDLNWDQLFEGRKFTSKITEVSTYTHGESPNLWQPTSVK